MYNNCTLMIELFHKPNWEKRYRDCQKNPLHACDARVATGSRPPNLVGEVLNNSIQDHLPRE